MRARAGVRLAVAAAVVLTALPANAGEWSYSGSIGAASGDYTLSERTTSAAFFNGLAWSGGRWRLSASLPVLYQDTPYLTYVGGTPLPTGRRLGYESAAAAAQEGGGSGTGGPGHGPGTPRGGGEVVVPDPDTLDFDEVGIGDPLLRADLRLAGDVGSGQFGLYLAAKAPVGDEESGFSTGEWDYGAGLTFGATQGAGRLFGEIGYWRFGDLPDLEIDDAVAASIGYSRSFRAETWAWTVGVGGLSEGIDDTDGPIEASCGLIRWTGDRSSWSATLGFGLTESAADYRFAVGWVYGL